MAVPMHEFRREYSHNDSVTLAALDDPFELFAQWLQEAVRAGAREPNAMTLATCNPDGRPSARIVLLKELDPRGLVFFTNYDSPKGRELRANPRAALVFWWVELERQVRVEGDVTRLPDEESDAYFRTRPRSTQLGTWASDQSRVIAGREVIIDRMIELTQRYEGQEVPRPPHWGGFRVWPGSCEFWMGRRSRLHDRLRYVRSDAGWRCEVLAP
jgi:pyridoxamine 5'-phosphate oxidase